MEIRKTASVCPECLRKITATIYEADGKVWIKKACPEHGEFEDLYSGSYEWYRRAERYAMDGKGIENPQVTKESPVCPADCGLCRLHLSHTALANVVLTNRCDLTCWYCFFFAQRLGYVYEPTIEQIEQMFKILKSERPIACNAVQLSLAPEERIVVRTPEGRIEVMKIGEFVDSFIELGCEKRMKPIPHERAKVEGWSVLSIDENLKCVFKPIDQVIRHENSGELFRITTDYGWQITTTGSHSIFVLNGQKIEPKPVKDLREGDVLLCPVSFPNEGWTNKEIDMIELIRRLEPKMLDKIIVCDFENMKDVKKKLRRRVNWDSISLREYLENSMSGGRSLRFFNSKKHKKIPSIVKITPELCRLLGYYVGKGCAYKSGVVFSFEPTEEDLIKDFLVCMDAVFGLKPRKVRSEHKVQFYLEGYLYRLFFKLIGAGEDAHSKRVPSIIYNVEENLKKEFLRAYFRCDGCVKIKDRRYEIVQKAVSEQLAYDILLLHLQLGIISRVERSFYHPHLVRKTGQLISKPSLKFRVIIGGKGELAKALWYLDGMNEVKEKFEKYVQTPGRHTQKYSRIPISEAILRLVNNEVGDPRISYILSRIRQDKSISKQNLQLVVKHMKDEGRLFEVWLNHLSSGDLGFFRVRKIERVKDPPKYVYDISVPGSQAFFAGFGFLLAHNTGGEPCLRDDLIDIIKLAKSYGFDHVQLNTNGIRLAFNPDLVRDVREAGVNTLYLSFDGISEKTNPKNHWEFPLALENARRVGLGIVLVPTVIKGVNDHEVGDIVKYAFKNIDIIRSVNFQPVSLVGRMPRKERDKYRITIPDVIKRLEEQTNGEITMNDFFPVPTALIISRFVEALTGKPMYDLSSHFACGAATYVFKDNGKMIPITRFIDVEGFLEYLKKKTEELRSGKSKTLVKLQLLTSIGKFIDSKNKPKDLDINKILYQIFVKHDYDALGKFHMKTLFIGMMHFMDLYNYDIERVKRCCIHYVMTDNRVVPFCAFNVIPEWYRDKDQESQGISIEEWERKTGRKISDDFYKRDVERLKQTEAYKKFEQDIKEIRIGKY